MDLLKLQDDIREYKELIISIGQQLNEAKDTLKRKEYNEQLVINNINKKQATRFINIYLVYSLGLCIEDCLELKDGELKKLTSNKTTESTELLQLRDDFIHNRITIEEFNEKYAELQGKVKKSEEEKFVAKVESIKKQVANVLLSTEQIEEVKSSLEEIKHELTL